MLSSIDLDFKFVAFIFGKQFSAQAQIHSQLNEITTACMQHQINAIIHMFSSIKRKTENDLERWTNDARRYICNAIRLVA